MNDVEYVGSRKANDPVVKRNCVRRITWFNPPYSKNVKTRVRQEFLKLTDNNFPVGSTLHKLFNRNMIKVSYSCMPNMGTTVGVNKKFPFVSRATEWPLPFRSRSNPVYFSFV